MYHLKENSKVSVLLLIKVNGKWLSFSGEELPVTSCTHLSAAYSVHLPSHTVWCLESWPVMLFPGGKEECHLGSVCDMWDGRPGNVTSGIGSLGISL